MKHIKQNRLQLGLNFRKIYWLMLGYFWSSSWTYTFEMPKSCHTERNYPVKYCETNTCLVQIKSGVPHSNVLGPLLYPTYTADLPTTIHLATFSDDTTEEVTYWKHAKVNTNSQSLQSWNWSMCSWYSSSQFFKIK